MVISHLQGRMVRNAGILYINDRLLHYVPVHILSPCGANFATITKENIFYVVFEK